MPLTNTIVINATLVQPERDNVDMEVLFLLGSKKISVVIPAGYDINKPLDNKGYCGFLRLLALLGGEVVAE